ncbi:hypothetical protein N7G274_009907 [Stereocaulon virgatum]|uniref:Uncharacterized protein n=1 Tax=Stereocaulon virgatum TaxID=373712 RepID=A0ABR3ZUZ6_9LECA
MHLPTLLPAFLLLLASADASAVFPRKGGKDGGDRGDGENRGPGEGKGRGPPSEYCPSVSSDCYRAVSSHRRRNSGFCGDYKSKKGRDMPDDMKDYSRDDVNNACDCSQGPAPQCRSVSVSCYDDVRTHRDGDSGFCRLFNSPQSCDLPDDLRRYSRSDVSSACYCLEPAPSQPPNNGPPQNPSPQCPSSSNDCYNEVKSRRDRDDSFCGRCRSKDSCDMPSDMSRYSREDMSNACDCLEPGRNNPSPQCPASSNDCYNEVKSRRERDDGFCGRCRDKDSCDKPSDMSRYSRGDMSNACDCLEPGRNNPSPQCPASSDNCYRDVQSRRDKDSEFCSRCRDKDHCDRPDELSMYSRGDMSKACDCLEPGRNNPSPQCPATYDNCYRDVKSRRDKDSEFCSRCRDKDHCDRPDELSMYSRGDMSKACDCLEPGRNNPSPQCPATYDNCYRDVKSRRDKDSEFCSRCRDKDHCDRPD